MLLALLAALSAAGAVVEGATRRAEHAVPPRGERPGRPATRATRLAAVCAAVGRSAGLPVVVPGDLQARISAAGLPTAVTPADVTAAKGGAALAGLLLGAGLLVPAIPGRLGLLLALATPAAGFLAPDVWLRRRATARATVLAADLPDVLDLVRVAVAAGLPVSRALQAVGRLRNGPLAAELRTCAELIDLGMSHAQALERLAARCPLPGVLALVAAVQRADCHGTPLAPALAALAADARADRARRMQNRAAKAAPKIQLAVALLLVPAAMLLMAAGLVAGMA